LENGGVLNLDKKKLVQTWQLFSRFRAKKTQDLSSGTGLHRNKYEEKI